MVVNDNSNVYSIIQIRYSVAFKEIKGEGPKKPVMRDIMPWIHEISYRPISCLPCSPASLS